MEILDLQYQNTKVDIDFIGDGVDHFDYCLTLSDANITTKYRLHRNEIEDLIQGTELFLKQLKEHFNA